MPLIVTAVPTTLVFLKNELVGMYISNTIPVDATPTHVVPTPTISPKSPS